MSSLARSAAAAPAAARPLAGASSSSAAAAAATGALVPVGVSGDLVLPVPAREITASSVTVELAEQAKTMWNPSAVKTSIKGSLDVIASRYPMFNYIETFLPQAGSRAGQSAEFTGQDWFLRGELMDRFGLIASDTTGRVIPAADSCSVTQAYRTQKVVEVRQMDAKNAYSRFLDADAPLRHAYVVPIVAFGEVRAILRCYTEQELTLSTADIDELSFFSSAVVSAGIYGATPANALLPFKHYHKEVPENFQKEVFMMVTQNGVFTPQRSYAEVDWFFRMGLAPIYFNRFGTKVVSNHILVYVASKQFSHAAGNVRDMWLAIENNVQLMGGLQPEQSLHMVPNDIRKIVAVERNIIRRIKMIPSNKVVTVLPNPPLPCPCS